MIFIGTCIRKFWGYLILQMFSSNKQENIKATNWYGNDKPILDIDSMLVTLEVDTKEYWMMDPFPEEKIPNISISNAIKKEFVPKEGVNFPKEVNKDQLPPTRNLPPTSTFQTRTL